MPHVFDIYYQLLMKQLTGGKRKTVDLSPEKMQAALTAVERKIVANGPSNPNNMNASFESFRKRQENPDDYLQIKPDSDTINGMSRYEYSTACRKELMKSVERSVRQDLEWRNATIRLGLTDRRGNAMSVDAHRWMDKLMKTDGSPESLAYNESIVALAALGNKQMTEERYIDWRTTYHTQNGKMGYEAFVAAAKDRDSAGDFIYGEVKKIVDTTSLDNFTIAVNAIASGDFSNEIFNGIDEDKRMAKAFEMLRHDAVLLGSEAVMMFQTLEKIGGFNLSKEDQKKVNTDWVVKVYPYAGIGNVANLTANPYFAIIDPYKHYRSTMHTPEVPVKEMKKREKDVLAYSVMNSKTVYEARTAVIYENILKEHGVDWYDEVVRQQGFSVYNPENTDKVVILEVTPTTANEMVGVKVCDRPGRFVGSDMSARTTGLLSRCAGWSRESHTSQEFENMRGALEAMRNVTLPDNPSPEDIKAVNDAFNNLKTLTNSYLVRKQTHHNGTKYEKARISFANDVMAFANEKLTQLDYCDKHIKTVSARQQQAENNQPPQAENNQPPQAENNEPPQAENNQPPQAENNQPPQAENNQPPQVENINKAENLNPLVNKNIVNDNNIGNNEQPQVENDNNQQIENNGEDLYNNLMKKGSIEQLQVWLDKVRNHNEMDEKLKSDFISAVDNYINCLKKANNRLTENNFQTLYAAEQKFYNAFTDDGCMEIMNGDFSDEVAIFHEHDDFMRSLAKPNAFKKAALANKPDPEPKIEEQKPNEQVNAKEEPAKKEEINKEVKVEVQKKEANPNHINIVDENANKNSEQQKPNEQVNAKKEPAKKEEKNKEVKVEVQKKEANPNRINIVDENANENREQQKLENKKESKPLAPIAKNKDAATAFGTLMQELAGASRDSTAAKKSVEQTIRTLDVFYSVYMNAMANGKTPTGVKATQADKDMILKGVQKNTALRVVSELVSAEQQKQKQSPKTAVQAPITQIVNAEKAEQLADLIADSAAFKRVFNGLFHYHNIREVLAIGDNKEFRARCAKAGQEFLTAIAITGQEQKREHEPENQNRININNEDAKDSPLSRDRNKEDKSTIYDRTFLGDALGSIADIISNRRREKWAAKAAQNGKAHPAQDFLKQELQSEMEQYKKGGDAAATHLNNALAVMILANMMDDKRSHGFFETAVERDQYNMLLGVIQGTKIFKEAFANLDPTNEQQVKKFMDKPEKYIYHVGESIFQISGDVIEKAAKPENKAPKESNKIIIAEPDAEELKLQKENPKDFDSLNGYLATLLDRTSHYGKEISGSANKALYNAIAEDVRRYDYSHQVNSHDPDEFGLTWEMTHALCMATLKYMMNNEKNTKYLKTLVERDHFEKLAELLKDSEIFKKKLKESDWNQSGLWKKCLQDDKLFCGPLGDTLLKLIGKTLREEPKKDAERAEANDFEDALRVNWTKSKNAAKAGDRKTAELEGRRAIAKDAANKAWSRSDGKAGSPMELYNLILRKQFFYDEAEKLDFMQEDTISKVINGLICNDLAKRLVGVAYYEKGQKKTKNTVPEKNGEEPPKEQKKNGQEPQKKGKQNVK